MKRSLFVRAWALLLVVIMVVGLIPATVFATAATLPSDMSVVSDNESTLAPGVTHNQVVLYNKNGERVEMYITTADPSVETVHVYANYLDNQNAVLGMSKTTEAAAAAEAKHDDPYTVVAAINASYYNMTTGKPTGAFAMEGNDITTESEGNAYSFFAVLKDGTYMIGAKGEYSTYKGQIQEAVGGYIHLVKDGAICSGLDTTKLYPRQTLGLTADGKVVIMTADGSQAPASVGLTVQEQAEVMLSLGCVEAIHLDGGGSTTHCIKAEGSDTLEVVNSPCDGSERSVSNSLIIVSTAVADGTFDHANLTAENEYVTPGSSVTVSAIGVDAAGGPAEIPENASLQLADASMGTVSADGVFTSNGTAGDAVVQMVVDGKVVGNVTIHVVVPQALSFNSAMITIPYGKTVKLEMTATYGINEVTLKDGDVSFTMATPAAGSVSGFNFTACAETSAVTGTIVNAVLAFDSNVTASTEVVLGKGSEIVADFEDGTDNGFYMYDAAYNYVWPETDTYVVDASTGKVHSGDYALAVNIDYSNSLESGYMRNCLRVTSGWEMKNATSLGYWIYIPDEAVALWARTSVVPVTARDENGNPTAYGSGVNGQIVDGTINGQTGYVHTFQESGWHYLSIDLTQYPDCAVRDGAVLTQFYISDRDGADFGYTSKEHSNKNGDYVFYIDDVTIDYSSAVDDRDAPIFGDVTYAVEGMADAATLNGNTVTTNTVTFAASVAENTTKPNATGLDMTTVKAYVDGNLVDCTYAAGKISVENVVLADGVHTVKFSICDKQGNYASVIRTIVVDADSDMSTIKVVAHDAAADRILLGSLYYVDIVATDIEKVDTVVTTLDLDNMSVWNLDHMEVAEGFEASYTVQDDERIATITITRTGEVTATGEVALVSMPIRTWELKMGYKYENGTKAGQTAFTYAQFRSMKEFWPIQVKVETDMGKVTFTNGTTGTFSSELIAVDTEMWANYANMVATSAGLAYYNSWNGGHIHTAEAIADKAATCTEAGYTGRTFCSVCNSVVDWGTTVPATGHTYEVTDGVLKCDCGELFNGEQEGVLYVDGVVAQGWIADSYYIDGVALTGIQLVDGCYYNFGTDGISTGKYSGLFEQDGKLYYAVLGNLKSGWVVEAEDYYYFDTETYAAVDGIVDIGYYTYEFVENKLYNGHWVHNTDGTIEYVWAGTKLCSQWFTLRDKTYYFNNKCKLATGTSLIKLSTGGDSQFFIFGEDGVFQEAVTSTGCYTVDGITYYLADGIVQTGLQEENGVYYYFRSNYQMYTGTYRYVDDNAANGLVTAGYCYFDAEDHHLLNNEFADPDGNGVKAYYVMGRLADKGLWVEENGKTYYINYNGEPIKSDTWIDGEYYYFDSEDGHLCDKEFIVRDNTTYYCIGGQIQKLGLVEIDGYTYYMSTNTGRVMRNTSYWVAGDQNPTGVDQLYYFDENGHRRHEEFFTIDGNLYYLIDGQPAKLGLVEIDGSLYYASTSCAAIKTGKYYVEAKNANGYPGDCWYYFGEDGKALDEEFYFDSNGNKYYMVDGLITRPGLTVIDGDYYYLSTNTGAAKTNMRYYIEAKNANGLLPEGAYTFDADGKIVF